MELNIYRYEAINHPTCPGPYICNDTNERANLGWKMAVAHTKNPTHPNIRRDLVDYTEDEFKYTIHCACPSLESLRAWFDGYNDEILNLGYKLVKYTVKSVLNTYSGLQVGFYMADVINKEIL